MAEQNDILQRAILDVNRMQEMAVKAAEKSLHKKYSKDLRAKYLENINEAAGLDDFEFDDSMIEEYSLNEGPEDELGLNDPNLNSNPEMTDDDSLSGGMGSAGGEIPGIEGGGENGLPLNPEGGAAQPVDSPIINSIPGTDEYGGEEIEIEFLGDDDPFSQGSDLQGASANLDSQFGNLDGQANSLNIEQDPGTVGLTSAPMQPEPNMGNGLNINSPGVPDNHFDWSGTDDAGGFGGLGMEDENIFDSIQINDQVLLEYIEKNFKNDKIIEKLSEKVDKLEALSEKLEQGLKDSNKVINQLKEQNIRLTYQNKVYNDSSLSENQKNSIVKALSNVKTITEANTVYDTVKEASKRSTKQINESNAINKVLNSGAGKTLSVEAIKAKKLAQQKNEEKNVTVIRESAEQVPERLQKYFKAWGLDKD